MHSRRRWNLAGLTRGRNELVRVHAAESQRGIRTVARAHWPGGRVDGDFAPHWVAPRDSFGQPRQAAALGGWSRQCRADYSEPGPVRVPDPVPWIGGVGASTAIVALSLYAILPILRNTCTGIAEVDPAVVESARGMGMTPRQVLWQVQLPLAAPVLLAGIRVSTAICIGVTTIAAAIGAGGLGVFIFRGLAMVNNQVILAGAIPAACLAILADSALGYFQRSSARR